MNNEGLANISELSKLITDVSNKQTISQEVSKAVENRDESSSVPSLNDTLKSTIQSNSSLYWTNKGTSLVLAYNSGMLIGKNVISFETFLKNISKLLELVVRSELDKKNLTAEKYDADFKLINYSLMVFFNHLKDNNFEISSSSYIAYFQGLLNSSLDNTK